jgi:hypothetical protein
MRKRAALIAILTIGVLLLEDAASLAQVQVDGSEIVVAQAEERGGVFRFLTRPFRRREPQVVPMPAPPPQQVQPRRQREASRPRRQRQTAPEPVAPRVVAVDKAEDAKRVMVVGDFMASALSKGLVEAYAENPNVLVIDASNGSSGLVRDDYYNWPSELPALVEEQKPDAILVLVGANDRQTIPGAGDPGSDAWRAAYAERVGAFADVLKATTRTILWVGLPPVDSGSMSRDYSAFNGIVREQLEGRGLRFIEIWDGFADAEGQFVSAGPDISGQEVQLRTGDLGLNFTRAGQRKLAFFVEQDLNAILGGAAPVLASVEPAPEGEPGAPLPQIGPMVNIDSMATGDALSGGSTAGSGTAGAAILERVAGDGAAPPEGRADDFSWPTVSP